jgi:hypothetical protein
MPTLTWVRPDGQRMAFSLAPIETTIGRDVGNAIRIESEYVSKRHAVVRLGADGYTVVDLSSSNGTCVNGRRITTSPLKDGDRVELGSVVLVFSGPPDSGRSSAVGGSKRKSLMYVVAGGGAVILLLLVLIVVGGSPTTNAPAPTVTAPAVAPDAAIPSTLETQPPPAPATPSSGITGAEGVLPSNDPTALYDMAMSHVKGGRLVEARRLLVASVRLDPRNQSTLQRLREVEATIQVMVDRHLANGQRAFTYLRYQDAILEWEQVLSMTEPNDVRRAQAASGIARARERLGR